MYASGDDGGSCQIVAARPLPDAPAIGVDAEPPAAATFAQNASRRMTSAELSVHASG